MSDSKITDLDAATALSASDYLEIASGGNSKKITAANLVASADARSVYGFTGASLGTNVAENFPRWAITGSQAPTAGRAHMTRIHLRAGSYTNVSFFKGGTQGSVLANTFIAIHYTTDSTQIAVTSDISTAFAASAASAEVATALSFTIPTDGDYWVVLLVGSASTMPVLLRSAVAGNAYYLMSPALIGVHSAGSLTSIPSTLTYANPLGGTDHYWVRCS